MGASNPMDKTSSKAMHMARNPKVVGSNPADPTTRGTGPARAHIFRTLWTLKKNGYSDGTLKSKGERLRHLAKHVNLDEQEAVKGYIANQANWSNAYKQGIAYAYKSYVEINGLLWSLPHFRIEDRLPRIPTEDRINQVIVRARGKYVLVFNILRDAGMRPIELERTRVRDIDLERGTISVRTAKGGAGRTVQKRS